MTNVEKLNEISRLKRKIAKQEELIKYYEVMSFSLGGSDFTIERVDCTRNLDAPFVKWIHKRLDAEAELKIMQKELNEKIAEMTHIIDGIENVDYKMIITYRYLLDKSWTGIAELLHMSISTVYRFHKKSLDNLNELKIDS